MARRTQNGKRTLQRMRAAFAKGRRRHIKGLSRIKRSKVGRGARKAGRVIRASFRVLGGKIRAGGNRVGKKIAKRIILNKIKKW